MGTYFALEIYLRMNVFILFIKIGWWINKKSIRPKEPPILSILRGIIKILSEAIKGR